jgi:WD40 repeat protein
MVDLINQPYLTILNGGEPVVCAVSWNWDFPGVESRNRQNGLIDLIDQPKTPALRLCVISSQQLIACVPSLLRIMAHASSQGEHGNLAEEPEDSFLDPNEAVEEFAHDTTGDDPMSDDDEEQMAEGDDDDDDDEELIVDDSIQGFFLHTSPVYSVALQGNWAATGGGDDLGYVWDVTNGEMLMKLDGHTDSVTNVEFSSDGKYLATGGMDGQARIWSVEEKKLVVAVEGGTEVMVFAPPPFLHHFFLLDLGL